MEANLASRRDERYFDAVFGGPLPPAACSFNCCPGIARFVHAPITTIILDGAPRSRRLCSLASLLALSASGGFLPPGCTPGLTSILSATLVRTLVVFLIFFCFSIRLYK